MLYSGFRSLSGRPSKNGEVLKAFEQEGQEEAGTAERPVGAGCRRCADGLHAGTLWSTPREHS